MWVQGPWFHRARPLRVAATAALLALATLAFACSGDTPAGDEATPEAPPPALATTSGEIAVSLDVPDGALPSGTAPEITIEPLDPASLAEQFPDAEVVAAFELGPDGLTFDEPALISVELAAHPDAIALLVSSDGAFEPLTPVESRVSLGDGHLTSTYAIEHFSEFLVIESEEAAPTRVSFVPPTPAPTHLVGESFTVRVFVTPGFANFSRLQLTPDGSRSGSTIDTLRDREWDAHVSWHAGAPTDIDAVELVYTNPAHAARAEVQTFGAPRNPTPIEPTFSLTVLEGARADVGEFDEQTFTCVRVGAYAIDVGVIAGTVAQMRFLHDDGSESAGEITQALPFQRASDRGGRITGQCVAPDGEETSTPTPEATTPAVPSPTAAATPQVLLLGGSVTAVDHPPFAPMSNGLAAYPTTVSPPPASWAVACLWNLPPELPPGSTITITISGTSVAPPANTSLSGTVTAAGHVHIPIPLYRFGNVQWSISSVTLPGGGSLSAGGSGSARVEADEPSCSE